MALAGLGYDISKLDGQVNDETRAAILKYEMDNGLDMGGMVDEAPAEGAEGEVGTDLAAYAICTMQKPPDCSSGFQKSQIQNA